MSKKIGRGAGRNWDSVRLRAGDQFYDLTAVRKTGMKQVWVFRCLCGRESELLARDVIFGRKTHCDYCKKQITDFGENDPKKLGEAIEHTYGIEMFLNESSKAGEELRKRDPVYRKAHENGRSIADIAKKAQEEGLTYGEYVSKYGI